MRQAEPTAVRMDNLLSQRAAASEIGAQKGAAPGRDWLIAARPQRKLNPIADESQRTLAGRGTHQPMMDHATEVRSSPAQHRQQSAPVQNLNFEEAPSQATKT